MAKAGVSNRLLGRLVTRQVVDGFGFPWPEPWEPNASGQTVGVIEAVWVDGGVVWAAIRNPVSGRVGNVALRDHLLKGE